MLSAGSGYELKLLFQVLMWIKAKTGCASHHLRVTRLPEAGLLDWQVWCNATEGWFNFKSYIIKIIHKIFHCQITESQNILTCKGHPQGSSRPTLKWMAHTDVPRPNKTQRCWTSTVKTAWHCIQKYLSIRSVQIKTMVFKIFLCTF